MEYLTETTLFTSFLAIWKVLVPMECSTRSEEQNILFKLIEISMSHEFNYASFLASLFKLLSILQLEIQCANWSCNMKTHITIGNSM